MRYAALPKKAENKVIVVDERPTGPRLDIDMRDGMRRSQITHAVALAMVKYFRVPLGTPISIFFDGEDKAPVDYVTGKGATLLLS